MKDTFLRAAVVAAFTVGGTATLAAAAQVQSAGPTIITVAKSPSCGCCGAWVDHMRAAGFEVSVQNVSQSRLAREKQRIGLRPEQASCHTASIGGYFVEGHVPAQDVKRLLAERPTAQGLAVPGMPAGSPGMDMGPRREIFDTILIGAEGSARIFSRHR